MIMTKTPYEIDTELLFLEASERLNCTTISDMMWYSWPENFSSTAGPHVGKIGGRAITAFQIWGFFYIPGNNGILYCNGIWKDWSDCSKTSWFQPED